MQVFLSFNLHRSFWNQFGLGPIVNSLQRPFNDKVSFKGTIFLIFCVFNKFNVSLGLLLVYGYLTHIVVHCNLEGYRKSLIYKSFQYSSLRIRIVIIQFPWSSVAASFSLVSKMSLSWVFKIRKVTNVYTWILLNISETCFLLWLHLLNILSYLSSKPW